MTRRPFQALRSLPRRARRAAAWLALAGAAAGATGCVERTLVVWTDPPGATVTINQAFEAKTEAGRPVVYPMKFYGVYHIHIEHPDCYPMTVSEPVKAPLHDKVGIDFATNVLYPGKIRDRYEFHYTLQPKEEADDVEEVIARAEAMREEAELRREQRLAKDATRGAPYRPPFLRERDPADRPANPMAAFGADADVGDPNVDIGTILPEGAATAGSGTVPGVGIDGAFLAAGALQPETDRLDWPDPAMRRTPAAPEAPFAPPGEDAPPAPSAADFPPAMAFAPPVLTAPDAPAPGIRIDGELVGAPLPTVTSPPAPPVVYPTAAVEADFRVEPAPGPSFVPAVPADIPAAPALDWPDPARRAPSPFTAPTTPSAPLPSVVPPVAPEAPEPAADNRYAAAAPAAPAMSATSAGRLPDGLGIVFAP